jgi:hypothetical protein
MSVHPSSVRTAPTNGTAKFATVVVSRKSKRKQNPKKGKKPISVVSVKTTKTNFTKKRKPVSWSSPKAPPNWEQLYALGLFNPAEKICDRIPNPMPICTAVSALHGAITITANASGYCFIYLNPWLVANVVSYNNNVLLVSDTYAILTNANTTAVPAPLSATNTDRMRVVSASLDCVDLSPFNTQTGVVSYGTMSYRQLIDVNITADTIRDSMWVQMSSSKQASDYVGGFYIPADPSCAIFQTPGNLPNEFDTPVVLFSGIAAGATISVRYHVNYEFVPAAGYTDLLAVELGPIGQFDNGIENASVFRRNLFNHRRDAFRELERHRRGGRLEPEALLTVDDASVHDQIPQLGPLPPRPRSHHNHMMNNIEIASPQRSVYQLDDFPDLITPPAPQLYPELDNPEFFEKMDNFRKYVDSYKEKMDTHYTNLNNLRRAKRTKQIRA